MCESCHVLMRYIPLYKDSKHIIAIYCEECGENVQLKTFPIEFFITGKHITIL